MQLKTDLELQLNEKFSDVVLILITHVIGAIEVSEQIPVKTIRFRPFGFF